MSLGIRGAACAGLLLLALTASTTAPAAGQLPRFTAKVTKLPAERARRMTGVSWHEGCPVALGDLRLVSLTYYGFDGRAHRGLLVVNRSATRAIVSAFQRIYDARVPIKRMVPVDDYGGSDFKSIEADNTSAFNCRNVAGSSHWSQHAYGLAIDVNPIENPYVYSSGTSSHAASGPFLDRAKHQPGTAYDGGALVAAFAAVGWGWGGHWSGERDYQHFSASGT